MSDLSAFQTHWHPDEIHGGLPDTPDTGFVLDFWDDRVRRSVVQAAPGLVIDVACGNARDVADLNRQGWRVIGQDPSLLQLRDARALVGETGAQVEHFVRAIAEALPYKDGAFDALICKSALDHFVDRDGALREFRRILKPGGRAVISANNYAALSTRLSRVFYRFGRALRFLPRDKHLLWDSPVPLEHTYECTYANMRALGTPWLELQECYGVSLLWGVPGWGWLLSKVPRPLSRVLLHGVNRIARRLPAIADVVIFVWRRPEERARAAP